MTHVGLGWDLHRLVENKKLILGGIEIPFEKGCLAHSDGDVLLHAIIDALLGASGLGDIGEFFPPDDLCWKNANSADLLKSAWQKICDDGWKLENIDCVIVLEKPKLLPYRQKIRENIALILNVDVSCIFIKAKTAENMGEIGTGQAVTAQSVCILKKD